MTTAAPAHVGPWTEWDLAGLPDDGQRYELLEGSLLVSPPPPPRHQRVSYKLTSTLDSHTPPGLVVIEAVGVRLPEGSVFVPDVLVVDQQAMANVTGILDADVVRLVVEIVSPGSRTKDRLTKPALYAQGGITWFWRVELDEGPAVHVYRLDPDKGVYLEEASARPGERLDVAQPFPISFDPDTLRP